MRCSALRSIPNYNTMGLAKASLEASVRYLAESLGPKGMRANGISAERGLSTPDNDEAAVKTAMVRAADFVVLVADSSKFAQESLVAFAALDDIDVLVTDAAPTGALAAALADHGVDVEVAGR